MGRDLEGFKLIFKLESEKKNNSMKLASFQNKLLAYVSIDSPRLSCYK